MPVGTLVGVRTKQHPRDTQFCRGDSHPLYNNANNSNNECKLITSFRKWHNAQDMARVCHRGFTSSMMHHRRLPEGGDVWTVI